MAFKGSHPLRDARNVTQPPKQPRAANLNRRYARLSPVHMSSRLLVCQLLIDSALKAKK
jgi:hypothetical protein